MTDSWDPKVPRHKEIAHGIEIGDGIAEMRTIAQARSAMKTVGFEILYEEDLADRPDPIVSQMTFCCQKQSLIGKSPALVLPS